MSRNTFRATVLALSLALVATATAACAQQTAPPGGKFQKVSALVALPDFLPGMGTLYVDHMDTRTFSTTANLQADFDDEDFEE